jgi:hypothetical protein
LDTFRKSKASKAFFGIKSGESSSEFQNSETCVPGWDKGSAQVVYQIEDVFAFLDWERLRIARDIVGDEFLARDNNFASSHGKMDSYLWLWILTSRYWLMSHESIQIHLLQNMYYPFLEFVFFITCKIIQRVLWHILRNRFALSPSKFVCVTP